MKYIAHTYGLKSTMPNGIPACLFNMTRLQTLHLSGNGIDGKGVFNVLSTTTDDFTSQ